MKKIVQSLIIAISIFPITGLSQDTLVNKLDSLNKRTDSAGGQVNNTNPAAYNESTRITFKSYFTLLGSDLKQEFTKPFHMTKKDWGNFGKFAAVAGALTFADKPIQRNAVQLVQRNPGLSKVSRFVTNFGSQYEAYTLAAFGAYGFLFKNEKMKTTTLLATQSVITAAALENVIKYLAGRTRPSYYDLNTSAKPRFLGPFSNSGRDAYGNKSYSSFPSGHTTVAFAAATVFAREYKNKPWVPIIAYSSATLIGLSRITENKHWATDVLTGAAVGFLAGKNIVNNYHRYAKLKAPGTKNAKPISFNLQYHMGHISPGLVYTF